MEKTFKKNGHVISLEVTLNNSSEKHFHGKKYHKVIVKGINPVVFDKEFKIDTSKNFKKALKKIEVGVFELIESDIITKEEKILIDLGYHYS